MGKVLLSYDLIKKATPFRQGLLILIVGLAGMVLMSLLSKSVEIEWFIASVSVGFFTWVNPILSIFRKEKWGRYFGSSIGLFILLNICFFSAAGYLSSVTLSNVPHYRTMAMTTVVFFFTTYGVVLIIKKMTELAGMDL